EAVTKPALVNSGFGGELPEEVLLGDGDVRLFRGCDGAGGLGPFRLAPFRRRPGRRRRRVAVLGRAFLSFQERDRLFEGDRLHRLGYTGTFDSVPSFLD